MSTVNYCLELPTQWSIHPVFHIDLLTPYKETIMHGPNFTRPAPELIDGEEEYSVEKILDSRRFGRRRRLQYLVKWEGYPDSDNMWVDKDDVFAEDKVREFKASNPGAETHIRTSIVAKSPHPHTTTRSHLLHQYALRHMSSNGDLASEYTAGAIADSPIPFSQENSVNTPVNVPIPIVNFTTLQPLNAAAAIYSPRPVSASSSSSDVAALFQQLRVHTPAPLTPDGQRVADQAGKTFTLSLTPAERGGGHAGSRLESGAASGPTTAVGTALSTPHLQQAHSNVSPSPYDLRECARCGEQNQYCHGHTPVVPNPTLDLPPRVPVRAPIPADGVARFNLSHAQATALAASLVDALEQDGQDTVEVPPVSDYRLEIANIVAAGLGIPPAVAAEGLGVQGGRRQRQNRGRGGQPQQLPTNQRSPNSPQAQASARRSARRPISPTPPGFEHNQGPSFIPFHIQENSCEMPARYIQAHLDAPNPYVEGRLSLDGPTYHSEIHAAVIHDVDIPAPPITADILRLLHTDYMGHDRVDEALGEIGDRSLIAEVTRYHRLEQKRKSFQDSITRIEDQLFTCNIERHMCVSRLEGARAMVRIQHEMQRNQQAFRLSPWSVECGCLP
jgi:hypothetical protein